MKKFWLFIYSTPNISGTILGLTGLALFFTGFIKSYWLFIVLGLYGIGYIGCPRNQQVSLHIRDHLESERIEEEMELLIRKIRKRVMPEILDKVINITGMVTDLLPRVQNDPGNRHVLVQTAISYLPSMLEHYLNLPPTYARFHSLRNGKTARQILTEQLILLENQLQKIAEDLHRGDADALMAHSTFLKDKFQTDATWEL